MGAPTVRSFIGGLRTGDRRLYVSTGDFTKEARYEAGRANVPVRLLNLDAFVRHYVDAYNKADDEQDPPLTGRTPSRRLTVQKIS